LQLVRPILIAGELMHELDMRISIFINSFANRSWVLDEIVSFVESSHLIKGVLFLTVFFVFWFQSEKVVSDAKVTEKRQILLYALLEAIAQPN